MNGYIIAHYMKGTRHKYQFGTFMLLIGVSSYPASNCALVTSSIIIFSISVLVMVNLLYLLAFLLYVVI